MIRVILQALSDVRNCHRVAVALALSGKSAAPEGKVQDWKIDRRQHGTDLAGRLDQPFFVGGPVDPHRSNSCANRRKVLLGALPIGSWNRDGKRISIPHLHRELIDSFFLATHAKRRMNERGLGWGDNRIKKRRHTGVRTRNSPDNRDATKNTLTSPIVLAPGYLPRFAMSCDSRFILPPKLSLRRNMVRPNCLGHFRLKCARKAWAQTVPYRPGAVIPCRHRLLGPARPSPAISE